MDIHRPLVRLDGPPVRTKRDDTVGEDDFLCTRLRSCFTCGKRDTMLDQALVLVGTISLATTRCFKCAEQDPKLIELHRFLCMRYGVNEKE